MARPRSCQPLVGPQPSVAARNSAYAVTEHPDTTADPVVVDAVGLLCPLPILRLKKRTQGLPSGSDVLFLADDPSGRKDLEVLCELAGHELMAAEQRPDDVMCYRLRLA